MFQKFNTDTLGGRFIKSLLAQTPIPIFNAVTDGDHIVEGAYYVYRNTIIKCVSSGILNVVKWEELYPSDTLYPSIFLYPGTGYKAATFYVKRYVEDYDLRVHRTYKSETNQYDSLTHYHLGRYLRYLNTTTGLNLLPFYNVYNSNYFSDVILRKINNELVISRGTDKRYKVVAVPILFGKTYYISIDCPHEVYIRACIHDNSGFKDESEMLKDSSSNMIALTESLRMSGSIYSNLSFHDPVRFRIETSDTSAILLERNLYMLIQLPIDNTSSIVVLENYNYENKTECTELQSIGYSEYTGNNCLKVPMLNPSLQKFNCRTSFAFSDRLIEYLLNNVIHSNDVYSENIATIQKALSKNYPDYNREFLEDRKLYGVWDDSIPLLALDYMNKTGDKDTYMYDQDGNINRDMEFLLQRGDM